MISTLSFFFYKQGEDIFWSIDASNNEINMLQSRKILAINNWVVGTAHVRKEATIMNGKKLGKGLGALLPKNKGRTEAEGERSSNLPGVEEDQGKKQNGAPLSVPIASLLTNEEQPRSHFDQVKLEELANSIREYGVLQPILVRMRSGGGYEIIAGERRTRACQLLGRETVPVIIANITDEKMLEAALVENLQREDLNAIEIAVAFNALIKEHAYTHEEVASKIGISRVAVTNTMRLLGLTDDLKEMVSRGTLSAGHARAILGLTNEEEQRIMARQVVTEDLSVREIERRIKRKKIGAESPRREITKPQTSALLVTQEFEAKWRERLGAAVKIREKKGKGKIEIAFSSHKEFARITQVLGIQVEE